MERKRTRLRSSSSYDEEEEEERGEEDRKLTLRRRKNPRYNEDDDEDEEVEEEGEEDNEQPSGPSTQNNHTQERFLKVTCGNKTGQLDKDKLYQENEIRSSSRISERSSEEESEIQSTEESEEDDVKDEDWCPASEELVLETEEERVELGNNEEVVDSGVDENKEEEDEVEKGEMEDEDVAAVEGNDSSDAEDSEDAQSEDERARSGSPADDLSITTSDTSTIGADEKESREEFTEDSEREEDQQREIKTESSPTLSRDIKPEAEHMGSLCDHTASLCASPVLVVTVTDTHLVDIKGGWEEGRCKEMEEEEEGKQTEMVPALFEDYENASDEHLDVSRSDATAAGNVRDSASPQTFIKEEISAAADYDAPTTPPSLFVECKCETTDATTSGRDTAELQVMLLEPGAPQTNQASDTTPFPDIAEARSSGSSPSCDLDTMDLDQLRREKIKMQIRVLRLQEEYYAQKIKEQRTLRLETT
ncbi:hypothetical protein GBF38_023315 [Nibea albiflora]|uniref:Uncharacterized protein n=1 Tax=Nibea albiflora TaxID=240163 RepID=A0ACB7EYL3_NIBAL|nr:hypothetical protein GBF38_023315 [Nibea albiflora]